MISFRWILQVLGIPFLWRRGTPLVRPKRIDWNPSLSPQTVQVRGHTLFYVVKGEGNPVLLIHGFGAGMWVWEKQIDILSLSCRVYVPDLIGHGFSDRPKTDYNAETYLHSMRDFMDGVGIGKATLVGNSMGGGIAWAMAALFPERVERLVLINCVPPDVLDQVRNDAFRTLAAIRDFPFLPYLIIGGRSRNSVRWILKDCVYDVKLVTPALVNRQYQLSRIRGTTWVLTSTLKHAGEALKLKGHLSRIYQPTLLIWGEKDLIFPPPVGESLNRAIPGSTYLLIEKSGHIPMWETPERVNEAILSFMKNRS